MHERCLCVGPWRLQWRVVASCLCVKAGSWSCVTAWPGTDNASGTSSHPPVCSAMSRYGITLLASQICSLVLKSSPVGGK